MRPVRIISRKDQGNRVDRKVRYALWNPQRPYAGPADGTCGKIWSDLHGDMQRSAEMTGPPALLN